MIGITALLLIVTVLPPPLASHIFTCFTSSRGNIRQNDKKSLKSSTITPRQTTATTKESAAAAGSLTNRTDLQQLSRKNFVDEITSAIGRRRPVVRIKEGKTLSFAVPWSPFQERRKLLRAERVIPIHNDKQTLEPDQTEWWMNGCALINRPASLDPVNCRIIMENAKSDDSGDYKFIFEMNSFEDQKENEIRKVSYNHRISDEFPFKVVISKQKRLDTFANSLGTFSLPNLQPKKSDFIYTEEVNHFGDISPNPQSAKVEEKNAKKLTRFLKMFRKKAKTF